MPIAPGPYAIDDVRLILGPDGNATARAVTDNFYAELDRDFGSFRGHILIQRFEFAEDWPTWEVHPEGDEFVYLLEGDTDFVLWQDGAEQVVRVNEPGSYVMVPQGAWHTARPRSRTVMLFVTPGEGTLNAEQPPGFGS